MARPIATAGAHTWVDHAGNPHRPRLESGIITGKTAAYKKAIVTLAKGDSIDFYSNI